jgi:hypothetical protein
VAVYCACAAPKNRAMPANAAIIVLLVVFIFLPSFCFVVRLDPVLLCYAVNRSPL